MPTHCDGRQIVAKTHASLPVEQLVKTSLHENKRGGLTVNPGDAGDHLAISAMFGDA